MSLDFKLDSAKIKRESKLYVIFLFIIVSAFYFFYATGKKYYADISKILKETEEIKTDNRLLEEKISSLKSIKDSSVTDASAINKIFQPEDPSLFMFSQLKALLSKNDIALIDLTFSEGSPLREVSRGVIAFSIKGVKENVYNFISDLVKVAPLSGLGGITFDSYVDSGGILELNMSVDVFYSPFPEVLPDVEKVINPLTSDEKDAYVNLKSLEILSKVDFTAQEPNDNIINPFESGVSNPEAKPE